MPGPESERQELGPILFGSRNLALHGGDVLAYNFDPPLLPRDLKTVFLDLGPRIGGFGRKFDLFGEELLFAGSGAGGIYH
jgi:hypothetical protein